MRSNILSKLIFATCVWYIYVCTIYIGQIDHRSPLDNIYRTDRSPIPTWQYIGQIYIYIYIYIVKWESVIYLSGVWAVQTNPYRGVPPPCLVQIYLNLATHTSAEVHHFFFLGLSASHPTHARGLHFFRGRRFFVTVGWAPRGCGISPSVGMTTSRVYVVVFGTTSSAYKALVGLRERTPFEVMFRARYWQISSFISGGQKILKSLLHLIFSEGGGLIKSIKYLTPPNGLWGSLPGSAIRRKQKTRPQVPKTKNKTILHNENDGAFRRS